MINASWLIVASAVISLNIALASDLCSQTNWAKRLTSKTEKPIGAWVNPHVGDINVLIVDGKRFENLRGLRKFYLPVPQACAIIFISDEKDYTLTYHVFRMDIDKDIAIRAKSSVFGHTIGAAKPADTIENADAKTIVLCNLDHGARSTLPSLANLDTVKALYYLDLERGSVAEKTIYLDKHGKVITEHDLLPK